MARIDSMFKHNLPVRKHAQTIHKEAIVERCENSLGKSRVVHRRLHKLIAY